MWQRLALRPFNCVEEPDNTGIISMSLWDNYQLSSQPSLQRSGLRVSVGSKSWSPRSQTHQGSHIVNVVYMLRPLLQRPNVLREGELLHFECHRRSRRRSTYPKTKAPVCLRENKEVGNAQNTRDGDVVLDRIFGPLAELARCIRLHNAPHFLHQLRYICVYLSLP